MQGNLALLAAVLTCAAQLEVAGLEAVAGNAVHENCFSLPDSRKLCWAVRYAGAPARVQQAKSNGSNVVSVLALHGMGMAGYKRWPWDQLTGPLFSSLSQVLRFVAIDRPGYGASSPPFFGYSYAAFASDLRTFIDSSPKLFPPQHKILVLGTGSGGPNMLALSYYLGPSRVGAGASVSGDGPYMQTDLALDPHDNVRHSVIDDLGPYLRNSRSGFNTGHHDQLHGTDLITFAKKFLPGHFARNQINSMWYGAEGWVNDFSLERLPWPFKVKAVEVPISIYSGGCGGCTKSNDWKNKGGDFCTVCTSAKMLNKLIRNSAIKSFDDCNHFYSFKNPAKLLQIIEDMLSRSNTKCARAGTCNWVELGA